MQIWVAVLTLCRYCILDYIALYCIRVYCIHIKCDNYTVGLQAKLLLGYLRINISFSRQCHDVYNFLNGLEKKSVYERKQTWQC